MYSKAIPILIPTLNRIEHLRKCISSLQKNRFIDRVSLIIGVDYPPSMEYVQSNKEILEYVNTIEGFGSKEIIIRERNYGVLGNYFELVKYASKKYEYFIFSEDDVIYSPNFIEYILKGISIIDKSNNALAVCAHSSGLYSSLTNNAIMSRTFCAWGYAMRCSDFICLLNSVITIDFAKDVLSNFYLSLKVLHNNPEALMMLMDEESSNDLYEDVSLSVFSYLFPSYYYIVPTISKAYNIGLDGSGVHCGVDDKYCVKIDNKDNFNYNLNLAKEDKTKRGKGIRVFISPLIKYCQYYFVMIQKNPSILITTISKFKRKYGGLTERLNLKIEK